jgi:anti-sigma factor ChrR (cupin superfamily)
MRVNDDLHSRAIVSAAEQRWVPSPLPGVERVMLDRLGAERGRATSLVRYAPGSSFHAHAHPGGEEILVLQGTFSDESGHYGPGWYLRHPPGSNHRPWSTEGALIFVKLWQMPDSETCTVRAHTRDPATWMRGSDVERCPLYACDAEQVQLLRLPARAAFKPDTARGAELLVIEGGLAEAHANYEPFSWVRLPHGDAAVFTAGPAGTTLYLKTGHLATPSR